MASSIAEDDSGRGFMLFGVRVVTEGSFRKSASMNNLVQYDHQPHDSNSDLAAAGYASDDVVHPSGRIRERKRGVAWSEEEHRLFLLGLQRIGKGDWRGISRNYVKTRTPTQVASHAQKHFLRRSNHNRRRRRSSLFDITTDELMGSSAEDQIQTQILQSNSPIIIPKIPMGVTIPQISTAENMSSGQVINQLTNSPKPILPIPILPIPTPSPTTPHGPSALSLSLSMSSSQSVTQDQEKSPSSNHQPRQTSALQTIPGTFNGGDSIISVA